MARKALTNVTLSDGTIIPKGYKVNVESRLHDPTLYPNPEKFEPDRFLKLRDTGSSKWQYITTSPEHMGFGYGRHACPGRFFATNEMKIILAHLLTKYDWKFTQQGRLPRLQSGTDIIADYNQKIMVKSRSEDIELGSL
jgi:cytochrome P450